MRGFVRGVFGVVDRLAGGILDVVDGLVELVFETRSCFTFRPYKRPGVRLSYPSEGRVFPSDEPQLKNAPRL